MNKKPFLVGLIAGIIVSFLLQLVIPTGNVIEQTNIYEHTMAVCNENECIDLLITCIDGEISEIKPISDVKIFDENFIDTREEQDFC